MSDRLEPNETRNPRRGYLREFSGVLLSVLSVVLTLVFSRGCSKPPDLRLQPEDVRTVGRIYESSATTLRNTKTQIQVRGEGAVEIAVEGDAIEKVDAAVSSERAEIPEESLWLPVLFVKDLPEYFEATGQFEGQSAELEAYHLGGGLWCIAAVLPYDRSSAEPLHGDQPRPSPTKSPARLKLNVALYSPEFSSHLPFLLPAHGEGSANISVALPTGSRFQSAEIVGKTEKPDSLKQQAVRLTVLPTSMTDGLVRAAASVEPNEVVTWDFSSVSFRVRPGLFHFRPWFLPAACFLVFVGLGIWLWLDRLASAERGLSGLRKRADEAISTIERAINAALFQPDVIFEEKRVEQVEFLQRFTHLLLGLRDQLPTLRYRTKEIERARAMALDLKRSLEDFRAKFMFSGYARSLLSRELNLRDIVSNLEALAAIDDSLRYRYAKRSLLRNLAWIAAALGLVSAVWLLASIASAQRAAQPRNAIGPGAALCDMNVVVTPHDGHAPDRDKVGINLNFFAISDDAQAAAQTEIGIESVSGYPMDQVSVVAPNGRWKALQQTGNLTRLVLRANYSAALRRLKVLSSGVTNFVPPKFYFNSLDRANRTEFSYTVNGAQKIKDHSRSGRLYFFPFDSVEVEVPMRFRQLVLLSRVELQKQADFGGDVWLSGADVSMVESEDGLKYEIASDDHQSRRTIWPGTEVRLIARFERTPLQKYGLTFGLVLVAALVGVLVGWLMSLKDSAAIQILVGAIGILGLPLAIRAAVFEHYKDLPTIATFQAITWFECAFLLSIFILAGVSLGTKKWLF
jgi:hypothetical protein